MNLNYRLNEIVFDKAESPAWADKIKRWAQLDEASYAVAEAVWKNRDFLSAGFDQLILTSTQGSSCTDYAFVNDVKISPSHFVHTLPNVRSIVFSILTGWEGPLYCLSKEHHTLVSFLGEAPYVHKNQKSMVVNVNKVESIHQCDFFCVEPVAINGQYNFISTGEKCDSHFLIDDFTFRKELGQKEEIFLTKNIGLRKTNS